MIRNNQLKARLQAFFDANKSDLARFGSTVNQTFEAFVIAQVAACLRIDLAGSLGEEMVNVDVDLRAQLAGADRE